jgi:FkbM family methyltransferase
MIVRDAEKSIERCIRSALPYIDSYCIIDTGCVDNTIPVAAEVLKDLPGQFLESTWVGHAHNRSELLAVARHGTDFLLQLDADMSLVQEGELPELTADSYLITIRDRGMEYPLPLLTSTKKAFFYHGVAHSYLACTEEATDALWLRELAIVDHGGGGNRPGKIEKDRDNLAAEVAKNPADRRSWFYLAQSYRDLDQVDESIAAYKFRASLGGWDEEIYYSLYQAGTQMCEHRNAREGMELLLKAYLMKPDRNEALRALGNVAKNVADKILYPGNDVLFVRRNSYLETHAREARPEVEEIFFHRYTPKPGGVVVELGAAEGTETPLLSSLVGPAGKVVAVEAHPGTFKRLQATCADLPNVKLVYAAVAEKAGEVTLSDEDAPWHNHLTEGEGITVPAATLDRVTRTLKQIDLLKVNIEGAEADVLASSPKTLAKTRNIVVSCHDFVGMPTKQRVRETLEAAGFDVQTHDDPTIITDGHGGRCLGDYLYAKRVLQADQVSAVLVTRGNVDMQPILDTLPYDDVVIWNNAERPRDMKPYGRYLAMDEAKHDIVYFQDDDVLFTAHDKLLGVYEPGRSTCNMPSPWYEQAGYERMGYVQVGFGALVPKGLSQPAFDAYLAEWPQDDLFLTYCDQIFGVLAPAKRFDFGGVELPYADAENRIYTSPGAYERKMAAVKRALQIRDRNGERVAA